MPAILITGGTGYIGSHTAIEIIQDGRYQVVSVDNYSNSGAHTLDRIEAITGHRMQNHAIDACDLPALQSVFAQHPDIVGVIHFAALKAVGESVEQPVRYYQNNFLSLLNVIQCCEQYGVSNLIFSSSCSVYGNIDQLPVTEQTPVAETESPYAHTKLVGERILQDAVKASPQLQAIALRYFNPVGGHSTGLNGEDPINRPSNLVPVITLVAAGKIPQLTVFGGDYDTRDGTCIRDFIHVTDIALAHIKALDYLIEGRNTTHYEMFNLGSGLGISILEAINAFEKVTGQSLNYHIGARRAGDVISIYSDSSLAKEKLGWVAERGIDEMMATAWKWQETLLGES